MKNNKDRRRRSTGRGRPMCRLLIALAAGIVVVIVAFFLWRHVPWAKAEDGADTPTIDGRPGEEAQTEEPTTQPAPMLSRYGDLSDIPVPPEGLALVTEPISYPLGGTYFIEIMLKNATGSEVEIAPAAGALEYRADGLWYRLSEKTIIDSDSTAAQTPAPAEIVRAAESYRIRLTLVRYPDLQPGSYRYVLEASAGESLYILACTFTLTADDTQGG